MHKRILLLWTMMWIGFLASGQQNWHFGTYLHAYFPKGGLGPVITNTPASPMYAPYASTTVSDRNGNVLFYCNGGRVFNKNGQEMSESPTTSSGSYYGTYVSAVPHPKNTNQYYIFTNYRNSGLNVAIVDMTLNNGLGNVLPKKINISQESVSTENEFVVVKQLYNNGYWVIAQGKGSNQYLSYKIDPDSIYSTTPVISVVGNPSSNDEKYNWRTGSFVSNAAGTELLRSFASNLDVAQAYVLNFDKRCGKITMKYELYPIAMQAQLHSAFMCYSPDYSKIFACFSDRIQGGTRIYQYKNTPTQPDVNPVNVGFVPVALSDLQKAPDGNIYVSSADGPNATGLGSIIRNPNSNNPVFLFNAIDFSKGKSNLNTFEHFPIFVDDTSTIFPQGFNSPEVIINTTCEGDSAYLSLKEPLQCDSFYWNINNSIFRTPKVSVRYTQSGKYPLQLVWFVCGFKYKQSDSLIINKKPVFNLGSDTTLCQGTSITLKGPDNVSQYTWLHGPSTQNITVNTPGTYTLIASNGPCSYTDAIEITYHPDLKTLLGDAYFVCDRDNELVKLDAGEGFVNYKWTPTEDTTQWIIVSNLGQYFVVVKDFRGCRGEDNTRVERRCPVTAFFPNTFTPNADGHNDTFRVTGTDILVFSIKIYNRWGQLVFEGKHLNDIWDGSFNGAPAPTGTYVYTAQYSGYYKKRLQQFSTKGQITLLR